MYEMNSLEFDSGPAIFVFRGILCGREIGLASRAAELPLVEGGFDSLLQCRSPSSWGRN